jgi:hypothetical protein
MLLKPTLPRYAVPDIVRVSVFQKHKGHLLPAIIRRPLENIHKKPSEESCRMIGHSSPTLMEEMTDLIAGTALPQKMLDKIISLPSVMLMSDNNGDPVASAAQVAKVS